MTGRPKLLNETQESELKNFILFGILYENCKCAKDLYDMLNKQFPLQEWNLRLYVNKFQLSYKEPHCSSEDMEVFNVWYSNMEAHGAWLGDNVLIATLKPYNPINAMQVIEASQENPELKTLGDYRRWASSE
jgi:hypothetical protein